MGPHPYPTIVRDLQRRDRRRGRRAAGSGRGSAARSRPRLRRRRVERDRAARSVHRRADRPAGRRRGGGRRDRDRAATRRPSPVARRASSTAARSLMLQDRRRPGRRGALDQRRPRLPGRRPADRRARHRAVGSSWRPPPTPRPLAADPSRRPGRGDPARARDRPRVRRPAPAPGRHRGLRRAATRTRPSSSSGFSGRGDKDLAALETRCPGDRARRPRAPRAGPGTDAAEPAERVDRPGPSDRCSVRRAARDGRAALIPYVVAGYPDSETSLRGGPGGDRRRRGPARGRPAVLGSAGRRRHPPARIPGRARGRRDVRRLDRADRADRGGPTRPSRSCRWATRTR